jgi:hypothetical protein
MSRTPHRDPAPPVEYASGSFPGLGGWRSLAEKTGLSIETIAELGVRDELRCLFANGRLRPPEELRAMDRDGRLGPGPINPRQALLALWANRHAPGSRSTHGWRRWS